MKTRTIFLAGFFMIVGIALMPVSSAQATVNNDYSFQGIVDNPVQLQCTGEPRGDQTGPKNGTRQAPRDGRGARRGQRQGDTPEDGSGRGGGQGQRRSQR